MVAGWLVAGPGAECSELYILSIEIARTFDFNKDMKARQVLFLISIANFHIDNFILLKQIKPCPLFMSGILYMPIIIYAHFTLYMPIFCITLK